MEKCQLKASSNYSSKFNNKSMGVKLDSGLSLIRATKAKKADVVTISWKTDSCGYGYLVAFYFAVMGKTFQLDLIGITGIKSTQLCKFVYGSFSFSAKNTSNFTVNASVEIIE